MGKQIRCQQTALAIGLCSPIRCCGMQAYTQCSGLAQIQALCQQGSNHSTQHIAHATTGHARVACRAQARQAITTEHQRAGALEYNHPPQTGLQTGCGSKAILLDFLRTDTQQAARLTRVRGQDPVLPISRLRGKKIKCIRIDHQRQRTFQHHGQQFFCPMLLTQTGTDEDHRGTLQQDLQLTAPTHRMTHQFRSHGCDPRASSRLSGDGYQSRTTAYRRLAGKTCRTRIACRTTDHQYMAIISLVRSTRTQGQQMPKQAPLQTLPLHRDPCAGRIGHPQTGKMQFTTMGRPIRGQQALLQADEGNRPCGTHRTTLHCAKVSIQPGGDIQCQQRQPTGIHCLHGGPPFPSKLALQSAAKQGINQEITITDGLCRKRQGRHSRCLRRRQCITAQTFCITHLQELYFQTGLAGKTGEDKAIPPIIAGATDHGEATCPRPVFLQQGKSSQTGTLHQLPVTEAKLVHGQAVQFTYLGRGIKSMWQGVHGGYHSAMIKSDNTHPVQYAELVEPIRMWGRQLGFQQVGISGIDLSAAEPHFHAWLEAGMHGDMSYMEQHGNKRSRPQELLPGTLSIISASMDYLPVAAEPLSVLQNPELGYVSRYALGRDYHKMIRIRLQKLAEKIRQHVGELGYRVFCDSAPVLEKPLAAQAGLGWTGKHSLQLKRSGSWFFLGEIYTDLPLPADAPVSAHCGRCTACIDICPTQAIVAPYTVDARRCISYLTIELHGSIPVEMRPLLGNRIFGCDDCQLACPWNRHAQHGMEDDFLPRHGLDAPRLVELFAWNEEEFLQRMEGSPLRRLGHERWLRNLATALGNAAFATGISAALQSRMDHPSELVRQHVAWALQQQNRA